MSSSMHLWINENNKEDMQCDDMFVSLWRVPDRFGVDSHVEKIDSAPKLDVVCNLD